VWCGGGLCETVSDRGVRCGCVGGVVAGSCRVDVEGLRQCLVTRTIGDPEGRIQKTLTPEDAATGRDTLARDHLRATL